MESKGPRFFFVAHLVPRFPSVWFPGLLKVAPQGHRNAIAAMAVRLVGITYAWRIIP